MDSGRDARCGELEEIQQHYEQTHRQQLPSTVSYRSISYANTHSDGSGWHYEWIKPSTTSAHFSESVHILSEDVNSVGISKKASSSGHFPQLDSNQSSGSVFDKNLDNTTVQNQDVQPIE